MRYIKITLLLVSMVILISCSKEKELTNGEGYVEVTGGKIWYRVYGQGNKTPILLLHGGPGYPSYYLNALSSLGKDRKIITFDQLGCGRSDAITDTTIMTIENFVEQTNKLLNSLGVQEFHLYGHSWGTMLGADYYLKYPNGVKSIIFASPCLSIDRWTIDSDSLISMLPDSTQIVLRNNIKGISQDSVKLTNAINSYWSTFYTRKLPTSPGFDSTVAHVGWNVYNYMWGPNDFYAIGTLKNYDRTKELSSIKVPTLYIAGDYDPARPNALRYYQSLTPNSKVEIIKNAGHVTMDDNNSDYLKALTDFLDSIEE
ncbi:MAG: proline iminopeptidase-family hydrolase [Cyclobacteriaceae bacterium]|nr:proline iminopeptidase-family hydrolase [Cyclobacteriaceae bacterium]